MIDAEECRSAFPHDSQGQWQHMEYYFMATSAPYTALSITFPLLSQVVVQYGVAVAPLRPDSQQCPEDKS